MCGFAYVGALDLELVLDKGARAVPRQRAVRRREWPPALGVPSSRQ
jgi:hypothetical protein